MVEAKDQVEVTVLVLPANRIFFKRHSAQSETQLNFFATSNAEHEREMTFKCYAANAYSASPVTAS